MSFGCFCPAGEIVDIPTQTCRINWREIQKIIFQKAGYVGTTEVLIITKAHWEGLLIAVDDTKAQISPFIYEFNKTPGDTLTEPGLNNTEEIIDVNASVLTGEIRGASSELIVAMKALYCQGGLEAYFVNCANQIICDKNDSGTPAPKGFPITSFFAGDRSNVKNVSDKNIITFNMAFGVEDTFEVYVPEPGFKPLEDL